MSAADRSIKPPPVTVDSHGSGIDGLTLARTKSGTLKLAEDSTGLHAEARLDPSNSVVRDIKSNTTPCTMTSQGTALAATASRLKGSGG